MPNSEETPICDQSGSHTGSTMPTTRGGWLQRCAARFRARAGLTKKQALGHAVACWDAEEIPLGADSDTPEDVADMELSYWES